MSTESHETFLAIVLGGSKRQNGMAGFADLLSVEDAERVHQYIIARANEDYALQQTEEINQPGQ